MIAHPRTWQLLALQWRTAVWSKIDVMSADSKWDGGSCWVPSDQMPAHWVIHPREKLAFQMDKFEALEQRTKNITC